MRAARWRSLKTLLISDAGGGDQREMSTGRGGITALKHVLLPTSVKWLTWREEGWKQRNFHAWQKI